jgi:hypothetical protein
MGLGHNVLVVMDHDPAASLGLIHALVKHGSALPTRFYTLMCCCQASYWEHGGGTGATDLAALAQEFTQADVRYERSMEAADQMFAAAAHLLKEAGVPETNISCRMCLEGHNLADAVIHELRQRHYSTVLADRRYRDLINRLAKRGVWRLLSRRTPVVTVWAVDVEDMQAEVVA